MQHSISIERLQLLILLLLDGVFYFWLIPSGIHDPEGIGLAEGMAPSMTARIAALLIALIIIVRLVRLMFVSDADSNDEFAAIEDDTQTETTRPWLSVACMAFSFIYAGMLLPLIGFYPASLLLLAALLGLLGERRLIMLLLLPTITVMLVFLLFAVLFNINLPSGMIMNIGSG